MSWNLVLRNFATGAPETIPPSVKVSHTDRTIAVFDKFPKAKYHVLLLPRVAEPLTVSRTSSLGSLLRWNKEEARKCLLVLQEEAKPVISMIEDEMMKTHGFKWKLFIGFHAVPSMEHLHLHIISSDLMSPTLKNKKHYNSFHPTLGFFLHLDDVLSWFDLDDNDFKSHARLFANQYEALLKHDLRSWRTNEVFKTIPKLKDHLQQEWEKEAHKSRSKAGDKRKRDESGDAGTSPDSKKSAISTSTPDVAASQ